jgi:hypothetical protein
LAEEHGELTTKSGDLCSEGHDVNGGGGHGNSYNWVGQETLQSVNTVQIECRVIVKELEGLGDAETLI